MTDDVYEMTPEERAALGIAQLPEDLSEAISAMEASDLVREALGEQVFDWFIRNKRMEWNDYRTRVTPYEIDQYLPLL